MESVSSSCFQTQKMWQELYLRFQRFSLHFSTTGMHGKENVNSVLFGCGLLFHLYLPMVRQVKCHLATLAHFLMFRCASTAVAGAGSPHYHLCGFQFVSSVGHFPWTFFTPRKILLSSSFGVLSSL